MKVSEIKTLAPKAATYEFRKDAKYIICFDRRTTDKATVAGICKALAGASVSAIGMYADALPSIFALEDSVTVEGNGHSPLSLVSSE